jgi:hypothetical protein
VEVRWLSRQDLQVDLDGQASFSIRSAKPSGIHVTYRNEMIGEQRRKGVPRTSWVAPFLGVEQAIRTPWPPVFRRRVPGVRATRPV